jgi:hypothetical protein
MYNFKERQQVYKLVDGEIEKSYKGGSCKIYTIETVDKSGVKLYSVPYVYFNFYGKVESVDVRKCPVITVNDCSKTGNKNLWHTWNNACIVPVEEF